MTTMQTKLTALAEEHITRDGLTEFVTVARFGNTGTWYAMRGLETLFTVGYDFQTGYATFDFDVTANADLLAIAWKTDSRFDPWTRRNGLVHYNEADKLAAFFDLLDLLLSAFPAAAEVQS